MRYDYEHLIQEASLEQRVLLGKLLGTSAVDSEALSKQFRKRTRTLWEKAVGSVVTYEEVLDRVGPVHRIRRVALESDEDYERRIVRSIANRTLETLSVEARAQYLSSLATEAVALPKFTRQAVGASSIVAAQASGFGVYQMATTVMGVASSAAGVTVPFIGYMALTKGISIIIGPLGWAALGATTLHKLTKPNYERLVAVVAWMFLVRCEVEGRSTAKPYSWTEIVRKTIKVMVPLLALVFFGLMIMKLR